MNSLDPERWRLFVAIRVPAQVKHAIEDAQRALRASVTQAAVRWTTRDQFHLTLGFLGNVEVTRVASLTETLRVACGPFSPLEMRTSKIGFFPNDRFPRVIWIGLADVHGQLVTLQRGVEAATAAFTSEPPTENFVGHLTLARIKRIARSESTALGRAAAALSEQTYGEWTAQTIELMRSQLSPEGAIYTSIAELGLLGR